MRSRYGCLYAALALVLTSAHTRADAPGRVTVDLRVVANRTHDFLILRAHNAGDHDVHFDGFTGIGISWFVYDPRANRESRWFSLYGHRPGVMTLKAGESRRWDVSTDFLRAHSQGAYCRWKWHGTPLDPPPDIEFALPPEFLIGNVPVEGGDLKPPYVDSDSGMLSHMLAFVFHQNTNRGIPLDNVPPNELAFLTLNGTDETLAVEPPLRAGSILHVSAPVIGFSAEITLQDSGFEARTIEPGESGQWRIPFERILEQIPAETVEAIRAADGALDLVWRSGDIESPPLPLILLPPTQAELDAAFLAEHSDVPRIDENTDLSLDLRLAGIESEPVFIGRLRNNEPHAVVADDNFSYHNNLDSSFRYAPFFTRHGRGRGAFIIESNETIQFSAQLDALLHDIRNILNDEEFGRLFCYEWRCHRRFTGPIWLSIPKADSEITKIHTYADKYLPASEYHRPDLPPIAPLLAYVHNPETPPELTCVLWNRTEEAIDVTDSQIVVAAPAIDYRRELPLPTGLDLPTTVAPGEHTDWRIAWQTIREMIPADDLARIEAAGGEIDLVWQVNGLDSPPLPLLLGWDGQAE